MDRAVKHGLLCLSLVLVILPLTHHKPGVPPTLKADEPAYYLAALSLVKDFDLRCELEDLERAYREFPYTPVNNLIMATDDGWQTVYFGKPYLFSFLAAPLAAVWGANGLVLFNSLLLVAMIWMATLYLRRFNADWLAALFAVGFFLMSNTYRYVYWLQPEMLNMFATAACLFFGLHVLGPGKGERRWPPLLGRLTAHPERFAVVLSASTLALGVYNKPMLAAMGLPVCFRLLRRRRWRELAVWLISAALALGLVAGISTAFTGHPTAYLGIDRKGFSVRTPYELPLKLQELRESATAELAAAGADGEPELGKKTAGWWWIFQWPELTLAELTEDFRYFFVGRHTGLFLYQPFALICLGLFAAFNRRALVSWAVLGALAAIAFFCLVFLSHNWHGGGGFVGNRYFLMVYPAFVYLVTRIRPDWIVILGFAAGGLFVGPLLLSPFGLVVPSPTMQANVRNHPFQSFPLEHSLREIPGYWWEVRSGVFFQGRKDHMRIEGDELWIAGAERAEVWLSSNQPLTRLVFEIRGPANHVQLRIEDAVEQLAVDPEPRRVVLEPSRPTLMRHERNRAQWEKLLEIYVYRMEIQTATGEMPRWRDADDPDAFRPLRPQLNGNPPVSTTPFFYLGCVLKFLGDGPEAGGATAEPAEEDNR